jgi:SAM-dependent methyltransferase
MRKLVADYQFDTLLDIGCGEGLHSDFFKAAGKRVTAIDYHPRRKDVLAADYLHHTFDGPFDCIWASHVLEHQPNVNAFLRKLFNDLKMGGILAITVPPLKHDIVGGHLTLWNAGLLLYNLVIAGFDCRDARCKQYGYNISVITPKIAATLPTEKMRFANGDIELLAKFFPRNDAVQWKQSVRGDIGELNWEPGSYRSLRRKRGHWWDRLKTFSLSLWERAGVRVNREKPTDPHAGCELMRRGLSPRAVESRESQAPSPCPLPEGVGSEATPAISKHVPEPSRAA